MAKSVQVLYLVLCLGALSSVTLSLPASSNDEERYLEKEYNRELMNWLNSAQYPQEYYHPCRFYNGMGMGMGMGMGVGNGIGNPISKRNSELINSLLSLPKSMNDAGK